MIRLAVVGFALAMAYGMTPQAATAQTLSTDLSSQNTKAGKDAAARRAERDRRAAKRADCRRQAKAKKFGIHLIQRNRFMRKCMAS